jgi:hypothetical protein
MKQGVKLTRDTPLADIPLVPIPLAKRTISGHDVYSCSDPIIPPPSAEWVDRIAKRIETELIVQLLDPSERKNIEVTCGPYKARYAPLRVRLVDRVIWFFRADRAEIKKILKSVVAIGKYRSIGYGIVAQWEFEDMGENDYSIFAPWENKKVLMKTIPNGNLVDVSGYKVSFGGGKPPYWHPENYMEIAIPC